VGEAAIGAAREVVSAAVVDSAAVVAASVVGVHLEDGSKGRTIEDFVKKSEFRFLFIVKY